MAVSLNNKKVWSLLTFKWQSAECKPTQLKLESLLTHPATMTRVILAAFSLFSWAGVLDRVLHTHTVHPILQTPYSKLNMLYPIPSTPIPQTPCPIPHAPYPGPHTAYPIPYTLYSKPLILTSICYTLYPLHPYPIPHTSNPIPHTPYRTPYTPNPLF